nr:zinc finger, CCHC-type [Tanacetum cinerariifolium]
MNVAVQSSCGLLQLHLYSMLLNSQTNFENEMESGTIFMKVVCETAMAKEFEIRQAAFECLISIASTYYDVLETYMQTLFELTANAVKGDEENGYEGFEAGSSVLTPFIAKRTYASDTKLRSGAYETLNELYLVEGSRDQVRSQYLYCYSIEEDPRTYNEAMKSKDAAFWKEAIDDEIRSIMENNTWVLSDLPSGSKPLGLRQKEGIDYFDAYALVAHITTIRLLLALAAIHNLVIHQMDVKIAFLNGDLDEEVYMK